MALNPDIIFERSKILAKMRKWQSLAFLFLAIVLVLILSPQNQSSVRSHIGRVTITGIITQNNERAKMIRALAHNKRVKAVIVRINSNGGTPFGSEQLFDAFKYISKKKPVVTVIDTMAASGGYMAALAGERIFAKATSITGSIGVIMMSFEATELAKKIGIQPNIFKTSTLKAALSPFEKVTPEVKTVIDDSLQETYKIFVGMVKKNRKLDDKQVKLIADGRVYSGEKALEYKLIDEIGGEMEAVKWLQVNKSISKKYRVLDKMLGKKQSFRNKFFIPIEEALTNALMKISFPNVLSMLQ